MIQFLGSPEFNIEKAGKKAANLHEMIKSGLHVPQGFVVAFDAAVPSREDLHEAIKEIGGFPIAVRSSGCLEDLQGASFAGQYKTFLEIDSVETALAKIFECRNSASSEGVRAYLKKNGLNEIEAKVSVLIQKMVEPRIAGVGFSIHPLTGQEEHALVEFCPGLGERLVSGLITPSSAVIELESGKIVSLTSGSEPADFGNSEAIDLAHLLLETGAYFGCPQDVEWAIDLHGKTWLLQSRPITSIQWRTDVEEFTNADFKDGGVSARVCTPLMYSLYRNAMQGSMQEYFETIKLIARGSKPERWIDMFYGRPYWNASAVKRSLSVVPGFDEEKFDSDLGIQKSYPVTGPMRVPTNLKTVLPVIPVALALEKTYEHQLKVVEEFGPKFETMRAHWLERIKGFSLTSDGEFFEDFIKVLEEFHVWTESSYFATIYNNANAQSDFKSFIAKMDQATGNLTSIVHLMSGLANVSHMEMQRGLIALYHVARVHGFDSKSWSMALDKFLAHNDFHSDAELDITVPRWGEVPGRVKEMVQAMLAAGHAPTDPDLSEVQSREQFEREVLRVKTVLYKSVRFRLQYLGAFKKHLERVRTYLGRREYMREFSTQCYYIVRLYVLEAARRFVKLGLLTDEFSVFMLRTEELVAMARGQVSLEEIKAKTDFRFKMYRSYRDLVPPNELGQGVTQRGQATLEVGADGKAILKGLGCSPGNIEGVVRVVESIEQMDQIQKGDILVTRFTDPGWTPVLGLVSGIVTEVGGLLSHAAVIGREYGIPAVLNLPGATKTLTTGQRIRIDGSSGVVELL